jgi:hypothetical protein
VACIVDAMIDELTSGWPCDGWRGRMARVAVVCAVLAVLAPACGGDDDAATPAVSPPAGTDQTSSTTAGSPATSDSAAASTDPPEASPVTETADGSAEATAGGGGGAGSGECPSGAAVSAPWGRTFELDEANATTGAIGLVFCPYTEVIAPGTTDQWGLEPIGEFFSITMTDQDPVIDDPTVDVVEGLGERGTWRAGAGELAVWADGRGTIISLPFTPEGVDPFSLATALAGLALELDPGAASVTPADRADIEAAAAEAAAGCPDPAEVGGAAGRELELAPGALVQEGEGLCSYLAVGDDPYVFTVNIGLSSDDFYPVEADEPTEDVGGLGDRAIWQEGYHLLVVWYDDGRVLSVQVSGDDLSDDDERDVAVAIAGELV